MRRKLLGALVPLAILCGGCDLLDQFKPADPVDVPVCYAGFVDGEWVFDCPDPGVVLD